MNTYETNRVNMIRTTTSFCDDNAATTAAITNYATIVTDVKNKLVLIDNLNIISSGTSKGVTLDMKAVRAAMQTLTEKLCNALQVLGAATSNNTMIAGSKYSFSKMSTMAKEDVDDICEGVYNLANTNAGALVPYGISATNISDTLTAIGLYRTAIDNPRQNVIQRKVANEQIITLIRDIVDNSLVKQLDKLTNILKSTTPTYYSGYYSAREVIDLGTHHTGGGAGTEYSFPVLVTDAVTNAPIENAGVKVQGSTITSLTGVDGKCFVTTSVSTVVLLITKTGYVNFSHALNPTEQTAAEAETQLAFAIVPV